MSASSRMGVEGSASGGCADSGSTQVGRRWAVIATPYALFVAHLVASRMLVHGLRVDVMDGMPASHEHDWYLVLCPQMFSELPPANRRVVFQMEQSISSRWFTASYLEILRESKAVLDYARVNVRFLEAHGMSSPQVSYVPVGPFADYAESVRASSSRWWERWHGSRESAFSDRTESRKRSTESGPFSPKPRGSGWFASVLDWGQSRFPHRAHRKTCDVLFYGDFQGCPRRLAMLEALRSQFDLRVVGGLFGLEMIAVIRSARLVVNLHYYDNALLEMPRIAECLSLGVPVVSESAQDQDDYPELAGGVRFFEQGSIPSMLAVVRSALHDPVSPDVFEECRERSGARFAAEFDRFLNSAGLLPPTLRSGGE